MYMGGGGGVVCENRFPRGVNALPYTWKKYNVHVYACSFRRVLELLCPCECVFASLSRSHFWS